MDFFFPLELFSGQHDNQCLHLPPYTVTPSCSSLPSYSTRSTQWERFKPAVQSSSLWFYINLNVDGLLYFFNLLLGKKSQSNPKVQLSSPEKNYWPPFSLKWPFHPLHQCRSRSDWAYELLCLCPLWSLWWQGEGQPASTSAGSSCQKQSSTRRGRNDRRSGRKSENRTTPRVRTRTPRQRGWVKGQSSTYLCSMVSVCVHSVQRLQRRSTTPGPSSTDCRSRRTRSRRNMRSSLNSVSFTQTQSVKFNSAGVHLKPTLNFISGFFKFYF